MGGSDAASEGKNYLFCNYIAFFTKLSPRKNNPCTYIEYIQNINTKNCYEHTLIEMLLVLCKDCSYGV